MLLLPASNQSIFNSGTRVVSARSKIKKKIIQIRFFICAIIFTHREIYNSAEDWSVYNSLFSSLDNKLNEDDDDGGTQVWSGGGEAVDGSDGLGNSSSTNYHPGALNYIFLPPLFTAHSSFSLESIKYSFHSILIIRCDCYCRLWHIFNSDE